MRPIFLLFVLLFSTGLLAQNNTVKFESAGIVFTGDINVAGTNSQIVEFTGNVHFTTDIVEIDKAEKIVYDKKTKTFTISGFSELLLNGEKKLASDLGSTTLKIDLGDSVAYLIADSKACPGGKAKGC